MKYVKMLEQRNLKKENLSKTIQKKIDELEHLTDYIGTLDKEDFDEEDQKNFDEIESKVKILDFELEKQIRKFNPEVYEKRIAHINSKIRKTDEKVEVETEEKEEVKEELKVEETEVEEVESVSLIEEQKPAIVQATEEPVAKDDAANRKKIENINSKLQNLKEELTINTRKFDEDQKVIKKAEPVVEAEEVEAEEVEEFEKKGNVKPKKGSLSIIIMAVGFGLLTFGAVNFFKERR
jgi:hypothetical protein